MNGKIKAGDICYTGYIRRCSRISIIDILLRVRYWYITRTHIHKGGIKFISETEREDFVNEWIAEANANDENFSIYSKADKTFIYSGELVKWVFGKSKWSDIDLIIKETM